MFSIQFTENRSPTQVPIDFLLINILNYPFTISLGGQYVPHELSFGFDADRAYILVLVGNKFANIDPLSHASK